MKQKLFTLPCLLFLLFSITSNAQVLWSETFNGADSTEFTLNTTDVIDGTPCVSGSVYNQWVINKSYSGGTVNPISVCSGAGSVSGPINNTPSEPAGVVGGPNSYYLHICCPLYASNTPPISNASWCYAANGIFDFCPPAENYFAKMNVGVSTLGSSNVYLKFYWACGGVTTYAQAYYSVDGGSTWTQAGSNFTGQSTWQLDSIHVAAFDNVADLRFGFLWVNPYNSFSTSGTDPAIALDDISIEVPGGVVAGTITTGTITGSPFCAGANISVPYTVTGTITGTFTVQLSDANGSFASPTNIGTGTSSPIPAAIPAGATTGSGYLIRVINGSVTGSNTSALTINASVAASVDISTTGNTICAGTSTTFSAAPKNGGATPSYQWKINGTNVGTDSSNFTSASLANGDVVTCVLTSNAPCVTGSPFTSNALTMTVAQSVPVTISISALPGTTVCPGTTITYSTNVTNGGSSPMYQWQDSGKSIPGATSSTYVDANPHNDDKITCIVTSNSPCIKGTSEPTSNEIDITINNNGVTAGTINTNGDTSICSKTITALKLVGYTPGTTIQWQSSTTGSNYANVSGGAGGTTASYTTAILTQTTYYRAIVNSGPCSATSDTVKITIVAPPAGTFTFTVNGPTATFNSSGITGATGYSWNFGDGSPLSGATNPTHTFDSTNVAFDVCLTATNSSNCNFTTCQNVTVYPTGINNIALGNTWQIYPDPFTNQLYISSASAQGDIQQIEIYDVVGRMVLQQKLNGTTQQLLQIDVSGLLQGIYFLRIDSREGSFEKSVIKQ